MEKRFDHKFWSNSNLVAILIVVGFFAGVLSFSAQGFRSRYIPTSSLANSSRFIEEVSTGSYVAFGHLTEPSNNNYITKLCVMGLDNSGNVIWEKRYGQDSAWYFELNGLARQGIKYQNHIYYAGVTGQNGAQNGVFIKMNFNGDTIWQKVFKEVNWTTAPQIIAPSIDGGFLLAGFAEDMIWPGRPAMLIKTDSNGNLIWKKKFNKTGKNVSYGRCVIQDPTSKKIVMGGYCYGNTSDSLFPWIIVTDSIGTLLEQKRLGIEEGYVSDIVRLLDGSYVAVGAMKTSSLVTSGDLHLQYAFHTRFKLGQSNPIYFNSFDRLSSTNYFSTAVVLPNGTDYVLSGALDTLYQHFPPYSYNEMMRISYFDSSGLLLKNTYHSYPSFADPKKPYFENMMSFNHLSSTSDGGLVAAIQINNITTLTPFYFVKFDTNGCDTSLAYCQNPTAISQKEIGGILNCYPNPVQAKLYIDQTNVNDFFENVKVMTLAGNFIKLFELKRNFTTLDFTDFVGGMYLLQFRDVNGKLFVKKIVVER